MKTPPPPLFEPDEAQRVRLTITVTPRVHEAFSRLAKASGMSLGRAMGEWLGDTLEAVEFTAQKVEEARAAPKMVMREMHAYALGLADETGVMLKQIRQKAAAGAPAPGKRSAGADAPASSLPPRPVIRGGKSPNPSKPRGGK